MKDKTDRYLLFFYNWIDFILVISLFCSLFIITWGYWPDMMVDFGRELYVPWQIASGGLLYQNIAYFNGPFSPYINAIWFLLFGSNILTLYVINTIFLAFFSVLLWYLIKNLSNRLVALVSILVFLCCFAFAQLIGMSNYNFITPYSHEAIHGLYLCTLLILCFWLFYKDKSKKYLIASAIVYGLSLLTKSDILITSTAISFTYFGANFFKTDKKVFINRLCLFVTVIFFLLVTVLGLLSIKISYAVAMRGMLGPFLELFRFDISGLKFYKSVMGVDDIGGNVLLLIKGVFSWVVYFLPALFMFRNLKSWLIKRLPKIDKYYTYLVGLVYCLFLVYFKSEIDFFGIWRPLPIIAFIIFIYSIKSLRQVVDDKMFLLLLVSVASLSFLLKVFLNVKISHYGFYLSVFPVALAIITFLHILPKILFSKDFDPNIIKVPAITFLIWISFMSISLTIHFKELKNIEVNIPYNSFYTDNRGLYFAEVSNQIYKDNPDATVIVLPEGVMFNFLSRFKNPTPYNNFMPPEMLLWGENQILDSIKINPPDYFVITHKDTSEYGYQFFGKDYAKSILDYVADNYITTAILGDIPLQPKSRFGIAIMKKKDKL